MVTSYVTATRYHDFSYGHRVVGHESKCAFLHGHNGRVHFTVSANLDHVGRVLDFSSIKSTLCAWLEENWDHKFIAWDQDRVMEVIQNACMHYEAPSDASVCLYRSIVWVPFNPTAENMALHLLNIIGPRILPAGVALTRVVVEETRKCSAEASAA